MSWYSLAKQWRLSWFPRKRPDLTLWEVIVSNRFHQTQIRIFHRQGMLLAQKSVYLLTEHMREVRKPKSYMPNGTTGMIILNGLIGGSGFSFFLLSRRSASIFSLYAGSPAYFLTSALLSFAFCKRYGFQNCAETSRNFSPLQSRIGIYNMSFVTRAQRAIFETPNYQMRWSIFLRR